MFCRMIFCKISKKTIPWEKIIIQYLNFLDNEMKMLRNPFALLRFLDNQIEYQLRRKEPLVYNWNIIVISNL